MTGPQKQSAPPVLVSTNDLYLNLLFVGETCWFSNSDHSLHIHQLLFSITFFNWEITAIPFKRQARAIVLSLPLLYLITIFPINYFINIMDAEDLKNGNLTVKLWLWTIMPPMKRIILYTHNMTNVRTWLHGKIISDILPCKKKSYDSSPCTCVWDCGIGCWVDPLRTRSKGPKWQIPEQHLEVVWDFPRTCFCGLWLGSVCGMLCPSPSAG